MTETDASSAPRRGCDNPVPHAERPWTPASSTARRRAGQRHSNTAIVWTSRSTTSRPRAGERPTGRVWSVRLRRGTAASSSPPSSADLPPSTSPPRSTSFSTATPKERSRHRLKYESQIGRGNYLTESSGNYVTVDTESLLKYSDQHFMPPMKGATRRVPVFRCPLDDGKNFRSPVAGERRTVSPTRGYLGESSRTGLRTSHV